MGTKTKREGDVPHRRSNVVWSPRQVFCKSRPWRHRTLKNRRHDNTARAHPVTTMRAPTPYGQVRLSSITKLSAPQYHHCIITVVAFVQLLVHEGVHGLTRHTTDCTKRPGCEHLNNIISEPTVIHTHTQSWHTHGASERK